MRIFLCSEGGDEFTLIADSLQEAREGAQMYNAVVIRECTKAEVKAINDKMKE